jgi:hypothetical protein
MRPLVFGCFALWVAAVAAQAPLEERRQAVPGDQTPADHPTVPVTGSRNDASTLTERIRPSTAISTVTAVPRKNLIDEFIFSTMQQDGIPHAALSSDEEFFRRVHIDLTGRIGSDGTHFVIVNHTFWDHHGGIYRENNHYKLSRELDAALASLIDDLATRKRTDGRSLLDETMVLCFGEFGRTPGELNPGRGRDHYQYAFSGLFAGGGIKGGRIVGKTDDLGERIINPGWDAKRSVYMEDVATTLYSALGIDWTKSIEHTPSGRAFWYIEPFASRQLVRSREITPLFA